MACKQYGITLIEVPYWWDFDKLNWMATIHQFCKELFPDSNGEAIPKEHPLGFGGISLKLMHGEDWDGKQDLTGW